MNQNSTRLITTQAQFHTFDPFTTGIEEQIYCTFVIQHPTTFSQFIHSILVINLISKIRYRESTRRRPLTHHIVENGTKVVNYCTNMSRITPAYYNLIHFDRTRQFDRKRRRRRRGNEAFLIYFKNLFICFGG